MLWLLALLLIGDPAAAQPSKPPEVVCDLVERLDGYMEGRAFRGGRNDPEDFVRFTFRDHDPAAGTARMLVNDDPAELLVGMMVEAGAIVYLLEEPGTGKLMVSTATAPSPDGWSAIATRLTWSGGQLAVKVSAGACRMRPR